MTSTENRTIQKPKQNRSGRFRMVMRVVALVVPLLAVVSLVVLLKYRSPSYLPDMEFVQVPGGCYEMGCGPWADDCQEQANPLHEVCVSDFEIGKYEVTQAQWKAVMGYNPANHGHGGDYPVEWVSWGDVQVFMEKLTALSNDGCTYRLPTEAEWEYAARSGGKSEKYSGGDDLDRVAWHGDNSGHDTHPVGSKTPNGLGIHDMSGNVWEWCLDTYHSEAYEFHPHANPLIIGSGIAVLRGGSFTDTKAPDLEITYRSSDGKERGFANVGFRIVKVPASVALHRVGYENRRVYRVGFALSRDAATGVVTDGETGLQWYVGPQKASWEQAESFCRDLTVAGGGWRMPTVEELESLYAGKTYWDQHHSMPPEFNGQELDIWTVWARGPEGVPTGKSFYYGMEDGQGAGRNSSSVFAVRGVPE